MSVLIEVESWRFEVWTIPTPANLVVTGISPAPPNPWK